MITIDIGLTSAEVRNPSELRREPFTTGTVGREVLLVFSGDWSGLAKTAVFIGSDDTRDVLITGTALTAVVVVPHEVLVKPCGELTLGVYGTNGDTIAIPTVYTSLGMIRQGADPSGDPSTDPSLPVWAQVQAEQQRQAAAIENRIKKFYTLGAEGNTPDSDDGTLRELKVYGNSVQDGTPTPDNPIAIRSVVNPVVEVDGYNLFNPTFEGGRVNGVNFVKNADKTYTLNGTATAEWQQVLGTMDIEVGTYRLPPWIAPNINAFLDYGAWWIENFTVDAPTDNVAFFINIPSGHVFDDVTVKPLVTRDLTATYEKYVPYKPKITAHIPGITLRKVGDVADYVDVERGVVVRRVGLIPDMGALGWSYLSANEAFHVKINDAPIAPPTKSDGYGCKSDVFTGSSTIGSLATFPYNYMVLGVGFYSHTQSMLVCKTSAYSDVDPFKAAMTGHYALYELAAPTEEPIPADILAQLRAIKSYYPQTNVAVTSDEVDGAASFLYPVSVEKFVEYTKQQMGDTRVFIYDLQDIADNAYINAEYATVLAEFALDD